MRSSAAVLALALAVAAAEGAAADEGVTFPADTIEGWQAASQSGLMGGLPATLSEFLPPGETFETWTRMVTVITFDLRGVEPRPTAADAHANYAAQYGANCGQSFVSDPEPRQAQGDAAMFFVMACDAAADGPTAGAGDYTAVMLIETEDALHVVQRAWRGAQPDLSVRPISDEEFAEWTRFFDGVQVVRSK